MSSSADGPEQVSAGLERTGLPAGALGEGGTCPRLPGSGDKGESWQAALSLGAHLPPGSPTGATCPGRVKREWPGTQHPWVLAVPAQSSAGRVDWGLGSWTALRKEPVTGPMVEGVGVLPLFWPVSKEGFLEPPGQ